MKKTVLLTALLSFAVTAFAAGEPFAAWNFDKAANNIVPPAAGKWSLKLQNTANIKNVEGKSGQAVAFLGKDKERGTVGGSAATNFTFDCTKPFTVETVFKLNADAGYRNFKELFCLTDGERGPGLRVFIFYNAVVMRTGNGKTPVDLGTNATKTALAKDKWHLLTLTYDGKTASIYLNGALAASKEMVFTKGKYNTLFVGSFRNAYAYALQGAIDELKFYNYAKTAAETAEAYLAVFED